MSVKAPTPDEIRAWPAAVRAVPEAAAAFGIPPTTAYRLIKQGQFPVPILTLGRALRVTRAAIMAALDIPELPTGTPSNALAAGSNSQVQTSASDPRSEARRTPRAA